MFYLEDVESLVLHHPPVVFQLPHDELEVVARVDVARHDLVELTVEQDLAQQLDALALCDVALRSYQDVVVALEEQVEVRADVLRHQRLVFCEQQAEGVEGVRADFEGGLVDPAEEGPEDAAAGRRGGRVDVVVDVDRLTVRQRLVVEDDGGDCVPLEGLLQDAAAGAGALATLVALAQRDDDLGLLADDLAQGVGLAGGAAGAAEAENVGDDGLRVLAGLEGQAVDVVDEQRQQALGEDGGHEREDGLLVGFDFGCALQCDFNQRDVLG